jgi:glycerol-3-phosphate acyltransferase PlsY
MNIILSMTIGYIVGSIPFSYLIAKLFTKQDLRKIGSGNIGTTNVIRLAGLKIGILAFLLDFMKGIFVFLIVIALFNYDLAIIASAFAVIGHSYSIFMNFKGGKGVATTFGSIVVTNPINALILITIHFTLLYAFRYMSLSSVIAAISFPLLALVTDNDLVYRLYAFSMSLFVIYRHRGNIVRLIKKEEPKFSFKKIKK